MSGRVCHRSPYSGSWYPGDRRELESLLAELWTRSEERLGPVLQPGANAFVVPHAGLVYSGRIAAAAYRHLALQQPPVVFVLGFNHRGGPVGIWAPEVDAFSTPMGELPVDRATVAELTATGIVRTMPEEALCDHSVEIQLPFLQKACPQASVVPLYVSALTSEARREAAGILARYVAAGYTFLATSDFTHFGASFGYRPFPVDAQTATRLRALDSDFMETAGSIDPAFFSRVLRDQSATVCGCEPIALLLEILRSTPDDEDYYQLALDYMTSGDLTADYSHCVSYAALAYCPWRSLMVDNESAGLLVSAVRGTLDHYLHTGETRAVPPERSTPALERPAAAFVTLHQNGTLRGCVGHVAPIEPLGRAVPDLAIAAALEDRRFDPLRPGETGIRFDISILSPMRRLSGPDGFRVGIDGGYLKLGEMNSILLPQVAEGRHWTRDEFLRALAHKAGLKDDAYQDPAARLYTFRAQVLN